MVAFLLASGADPNKAGATWSTPLAWARKKGHAEIEKDLAAAGAISEKP
jgi:ankyrin repeat protein